jgi:hypothetical protein
MLLTSNWKRLGIIATILVLVITPFLQIQTTAHALSVKQKQLFNANILYYDYNYAKNDCSLTSTSASNSNVYVVGDSYSEGMQTAGLEANLKTAGYTNITINGHTGRSINGPGNPPNETSATTAINTDADKIKAAGTILIVLGTNPDDYEKSIPVFMKQINTHNGGARKFWVNIGNKQQTASYIKATNDTISKYSSTFNYSVIDWGSAFANTPSLSGGLHPTPAGYTKLVDLTTSAFGQAAGASTAAQAATTNDKSNAATIYSYLIGKGLTPEQTAGLMGNLQAESGFNPGSVEKGSNIGFGIVQWSFGRRTNLEAAAAKQGVPANDLLFQLDYMWYELTGHYKNVLADLKQSQSVNDAASVILNKYEMPKERVQNLIKRTEFGNKILAKYSGLTGQTFGCAAGSLAGEGGWDLAGNNAMTYYSQGDSQWKNTKYGTCTIGEGGCGPTSAAMIISTLTSNKSVTPPVIAKKLEDLGAAPKCGTDWDKWSELMNDYNLKLADIGTNFDEAKIALNSGGLVLASFGSSPNSDGSKNPTLFTTGRHLMVIRKINTDGSFSITDPIALTRFSNKQTYTKEILISRAPNTGGAINSMWAVTK